jgi:hypothetical protein
VNAIDYKATQCSGSLGGQYSLDQKAEDRRTDDLFANGKPILDMKFNVTGAWWHLKVCNKAFSS